MKWIILTVSLVFTCISAQSQETTTFNCCVPSSSSSYDSGKYYTDYTNCKANNDGGTVWTESEACCTGSNCSNSNQPPCCGNMAYPSLTTVCTCPNTCYQVTPKQSLNCQPGLYQYGCPASNGGTGACCSSPDTPGGYYYCPIG